MYSIFLPVNPLIKRAKEYLKELSQKLEEESSACHKLLVTKPDGKIDITESQVKTEDNTESSIDWNKPSQSPIKEETRVDKEQRPQRTKSPVSTSRNLKLERDEKAASLLDNLILYLRIVHSIDYYNATEYQQEDWMPNRCGVIHVRGSTEHKSSYNSNVVNILNGVNINYFDPESIKKVQLDEWIRLFEANIKSYSEYRDKIEPEVAKRLGIKDLQLEIDKYISLNTQKIEKDIWLCPISGKKFKGPDYVKKHIETKHRHKLLELRRDVEYFNRFVYDPKRPYLPEHPLTKNMGQANQNMNQQNNNFHNQGQANFLNMNQGNFGMHQQQFNNQPQRHYNDEMNGYMNNGARMGMMNGMGNNLGQGYYSGQNSFRHSSYNGQSMVSPQSNFNNRPSRR